jgi:hypothetical protein
MRSGHEKKNVFEYKASQLEPPVQVFHQKSGDWQPAFEQVIRPQWRGGAIRLHQRRGLSDPGVLRRVTADLRTCPQEVVEADLCDRTKKRALKLNRTRVGSIGPISPSSRER